MNIAVPTDQRMTMGKKKKNEKLGKYQDIYIELRKQEYTGQSSVDNSWSTWSYVKNIKIETG